MTFSSNEFLEMLVKRMKEEKSINNEEFIIKEAFELDLENLDDMVKWNRMTEQERCSKFIERLNKQKSLRERLKRK